jgi:hypothetical protein
MSPNLQEAIEKVYEAFSDVPTSSFILPSRQLREITPEELSKHAESIRLTVGSEQDFIYFLPRILEICVLDPHWWPSPEVILEGMAHAKFQTWPAQRRKAVLRYFDVVLTDLFDAEEDNGHEIDQWTCALGRVFRNVKPYLDRIRAHPQKLIQYYECNSKALLSNNLSSAFWDDAPDTKQEVIDWFKSPDIKDLIQTTYGLK